MRTPVFTKKFEKDIKRCQKRGLNTDDIKQVMSLLINDLPLEERHRPHILSGDYAGFWECHIRSDWLLIYKLTEKINSTGEVEESEIMFVRTGTHSDLF